MVTPRTGPGPGRPKGASNKRKRGLLENKHRYVLGVADAFRAKYRCSAHKARVLATLELLADKVAGGSYDISHIRGAEEEERALEKVLPEVRALRETAARFSAGENLNHRAVMAGMFFLALFGDESFEQRAIKIHLLSRKIGEQKMAAALIEAMRISCVT